MSWAKAINDSITSGAPREKTLALIQGGMDAVSARVQRAIDETEPADYPMLLASLSMSVKGLRQSLPASARHLAYLIEEMTASVTVSVPDIRKKPEAQDE